MGTSVFTCDFDLELITLELSGRYSPGTRGAYSGWHGNYLAGDAPTVENFKVTLNGKDITNTLTPDQIDKLENYFMDQAEENGEAA